MDHPQRKVHTVIPLREPSTDMTSFLEGVEKRHYHVLSYSWKGGYPRMELLPLKRKDHILLGTGKPFSLDLREMDDVSFRFRGPSCCVGRFVEGKYVPCPGSRPPTDGFHQCMECLLEDIPDPTCIFEPHCHKKPCGAHFCQVHHVVYVTAFRESSKIGMTQFRRMRERAMEQGADGMLPLVIAKDRYSARYFEGRISKTLGIPQVIRSNVKFPSVTRTKNMDQMEEFLRSVGEDLKMLWADIISDPHPGADLVEDPFVIDEDPILIDDYPLDEPLPSVPKRFKGEMVRGRVLGYKGSYMFYRQGSIWAYRLSEVAGKVLSMDDDIER